MSRVKGGLCLRITRSREQERHSRGTRTPATRVPKGHSQSRSRSGSLGRDASTPGRCTGGAHSCSAADRASQAKRSEPAAGEAAPGGRGPGHARPPPPGGHREARHGQEDSGSRERRQRGLGPGSTEPTAAEGGQEGRGRGCARTPYAHRPRPPQKDMKPLFGASPQRTLFPKAEALSKGAKGPAAAARHRRPPGPHEAGRPSLVGNTPAPPPSSPSRGPAALPTCGSSAGRRHQTARGRLRLGPQFW